MELHTAMPFVPFAVFWGRKQIMENDSKIRLLRILELLKTQTDENHPLTIADMEAALINGISPRIESQYKKISQPYVQPDMILLQFAPRKINTICLPGYSNFPSSNC